MGATTKEFDEGFAAQKEGKGFLDNPYDSYANEGRRWIDGYVASMQEKSKLDHVNCRER